MEQEGFGEANPDQPYWIKFASVAPEYEDAYIPDNLAPPMDTNIDLLHFRKMPEELVHRACAYISKQR